MLVKKDQSQAQPRAAFMYRPGVAAENLSLENMPPGGSNTGITGPCLEKNTVLASVFIWLLPITTLERVV